MQFRGGAAMHGPKPRSHAIKLNKKVRRLGLKIALSARTAEGKASNIPFLAHIFFWELSSQKNLGTKRKQKKIETQRVNEESLRCLYRLVSNTFFFLFGFWNQTTILDQAIKKVKTKAKTFWLIFFLSLGTPFSFGYSKNTFNRNKCFVGF